MDCQDVSCRYIYGENEDYPLCTCKGECAYTSEFENGTREDCEGCEYYVIDQVYVNKCRLSHCIYDDAY